MLHTYISYAKYNITIAQKYKEKETLKISGYNKNKNF